MHWRQNNVVCYSVCYDVSPAETAEPIEMPFWIWTRVGSRTMQAYYVGPWCLHVKGQCWKRKGVDPGYAGTWPIYSKPFSRGITGTMRMRLGCIRWECTLAQPGEYDFTVGLRRRFDLISYYFHHLFIPRPILFMRVGVSLGQERPCLLLYNCND